ncbi:hypothetical protein Trydic_g23609 [Trypoxylus dichotomus]
MTLAEGRIEDFTSTIISSLGIFLGAITKFSPLGSTSSSLSDRALEEVKVNGAEEAIGKWCRVLDVYAGSIHEEELRRNIEICFR